MSQNEITCDSQPKLPRGVRLKQDLVRNEWLLLAPERVIKLNPVAQAILQRCTGLARVEAIVDDLARTFAADRSRIEIDVRALLVELAQKRLLDV